MRRVIVGTAGHIDHGKTRLVEAITGIDCDRWEEERRRGITIDIGFAHLERDGLQIGFIDVPGHERFLHNALAGLGGIRIALLVVAADEGVEPQTLEHLDICTLLGIPRALVVLTKADLVSGDLLELARLEVGELMAGSPWPEARVLTASSTTGEGVAGVVDHLVELAVGLPDERREAEVVRLPVDRAFQLRGLGSIVTGTLVSGRIGTGSTLEVLPAPRSGSVQAKVRSIEVHGATRDEALAGERTALQLAGVGLGDLERGRELVEPGALAATTSLLVDMRVLSAAPIALEGWTDVQVHLYASEVRGRLRPLDPERVEPGANARAEIRLAAPLVAARGDRFVVRRLSPAATLGGGVVLDPAWRRYRGDERRPAITALAGADEDAVRFWVGATRLEGLAATDLARLCGWREADAEALLGRLERGGRLLRIEPGPSSGHQSPAGHQGRSARWIEPERFADLERRARVLLEEYLAERPKVPGMPRAEAVRRLMPSLSPDLVRIYLDWLEARQVLAQNGDLVNLPGREARLTGEESALARRLEAIYEEAALQPPAPAEVARSLGVKPQIVAGLVHYMVQQGTLARLGGGLVISLDALERTRRDLVASGLDDFTVADFKDRFGISRKWAIPILEYFDAQRVTHRLGNLRRVARGTPGAPQQGEGER